jgi:hypothetical protein
MGIIRYIGAIMVFVFGPIAAIASYRSLKPPFSYMSVVLGLISLAFVPFVAVDIFNALSTYTVVVTGGAENMIVYPFLLWMLGFWGIPNEGLILRFGARSHRAWLCNFHDL